MPRRLVTVALLAGLVALLAGPRVGGGEDAPPAKDKRAVYLVQHGNVKDLAAALGKHFKDEADIQAVAGPSASYLLVRAAPPVVDEVLKLVAGLDRSPRLVSVELLLVEVPMKATADDKGVDAKEFSGTAKEVMEKVAAYRKKGVLGDQRRLQFTTVENQPISLGVGKSAPYVAGVSSFRGMDVQRTIVYRDMGTVAKVLARVAGDKTVTLDLEVQHSGMYTSEDGTVLGKDESGSAVRAPAFHQAVTTTKVNIRSGQALAVKEARTTSKSGEARTWIIATAKVVEPAAGEAK